MDAIKSKRFLCWAISLIVFCLMSMFSKQDVLSIAGALSMLSGLYLSMESFKPSLPVKKDPNDVG